jgi:deoxyribonuclease V
MVEERSVWLPTIEAYQPGRFYPRELPAITGVLATTAGVDLLAVDGYVDLDPQGRPGLGFRVHARTGVPVIGVAKTAFRTATHAVTAMGSGSGTCPAECVTGTTERRRAECEGR